MSTLIIQQTLSLNPTSVDNFQVFACILSSRWIRVLVRSLYSEIFTNREFENWQRKCIKRCFMTIQTRTGLKSSKLKFRHTQGQVFSFFPFL